MSKTNKILLIAFSILVVSSFIPILPILLLQLNGAVLFLFGSSKALVPVNVIAALIGLVMFHFAKKLAYRICAVVIVICFLFPLVIFKSEGWSNNESLPYFLPFLIASILAIVPLIILSFVKNKP